MALSFSPEFNPSFEIEYSGGEGIFKEIEALNGLSEKLGIAKLSDFADSREVPEDYEGDPEDLEEVMGKWHEWFAPQEGLEVVSKLKTALVSDEELFSQKIFQIVIEDLTALEHVLKEALKTNTQFRLQVL